MKRSLFFGAMLVFPFVQLAWTQVPRTMNYQGVLKDAGGPLDGNYDLAFRIYDNADNLLWSETHSTLGGNAVPITKGVFTVILGSVTPLPDPFPSPAWLAVVGPDGVEMTPRTELTAVPYSLRADHAEAASSADTAQSVQGSSNVFPSSGSVGIGTVGPSSELEVVGKVTATSFVGDGSGLSGISADQAQNSDSLGHVVAAAYATDSELSSHTSNASAHHTRYSDADAVTAMGTKADTNPLHHDKTTSLPFTALTGTATDGQVPDDITIDSAEVAGSADSLGHVEAVAYATDDEVMPIVLASDGSGSGLNADSLDGLDASAFWRTSGNSGTTAGTNYLGTSDNQALEFHVNGARALRLEPHATSPNVIGGYSGNSVTQSAVGATISGGGESGGINLVSSDYGTVGGGYYNTVDGLYATVSGGFNNSANGGFATVPGGRFNQASAAYCFAAGYRAKAVNTGSFVWADSTDADFTSTGQDQFLIRASGGVGIGTNSPSSMLHLADGDLTISGTNQKLELFSTNRIEGAYGALQNTISTGNHWSLLWNAYYDWSSNQYRFLNDNSQGALELLMQYNNGFDFRIKAGPSTAGSAFSWDQTVLEITSTGNVGIGMTNPRYILHLKDTDTLGTRLVFQNTNNDIDNSYAINVGGILSSRKNKLTFYGTYDNGTLIRNIMTMTWDGNVGIGTTDPLSILTLNSSGGPAIRYEAGGVGKWSSGMITGDDRFTLYALGGAGYVMQLDHSTGNVGIGTTSPEEKLVVADGAIRNTSAVVTCTSPGTWYDMDSCDGMAGLYIVRGNRIENGADECSYIIHWAGNYYKNEVIVVSSSLSGGSSFSLSFQGIGTGSATKYLQVRANSYSCVVAFSKIFP